MKIEVKRLDPSYPLPAYARQGDAGLDLIASEDLILAPGERGAVGTGLSLAIPAGFAGFVHARSGRALKEGLAVANAPGLIDSGYRGEVKVILVNLDPAETIEIAAGEKVAQLVIQAVESAELSEVSELPSSARGAGGFGSTGR